MVRFVIILIKFYVCMYVCKSYFEKWHLKVCTSILEFLDVLVIPTQRQSSDGGFSIIIGKQTGILTWARSAR